jgi:DNA polymerase III alpha subunit
VNNQQAKIQKLVGRTGIHACGVIHNPNQMLQISFSDYCKRDSDLYVTQFDDNSISRGAGLLKGLLGFENHLP